MKTLLNLLCYLLLSIALLTSTSCSSKTTSGFYDARLRYANPKTGSSSVIPAVVYIKNDKIKSVIIVDQP